jgi:hypothetical protein
LFNTGFLLELVYLYAFPCWQGVSGSHQGCGLSELVKKLESDFGSGVSGSGAYPSKQNLFETDKSLHMSFGYYFF